VNSRGGRYRASPVFGSPEASVSSNGARK
jgi:hypothetical protein